MRTRLKRDHSPPPQRETVCVRVPRGRRAMVATMCAPDVAAIVLWTAPQRRSRFAEAPAMVTPPRASAAAGAIAATASTTTATVARERARTPPRTLIGNGRYQVALGFVAQRRWGFGGPV